jgi:glycerol-3-phosphate acyltransferase PlsY
MKAALDVTTSGYMELSEGAFIVGLPMVALYLLGLSTGNWWYTMAGRHDSAQSRVRSAGETNSARTMLLACQE